MCEDSLVAGEKAPTKFSDGTSGYSITSRTLTLTSENGPEVRAVAEP